MRSAIGLLDNWLDVLGCPYCQGGLTLGGQDLLLCTCCQERFGVHGSVPRLLPAAREAALAEWSCFYREARLRDGWQPFTPEQLLALPFSSPPGYPALYWQVRRQTYRALLRILAARGTGPANGPVADLGAGVGWLSFRLAERGYRVLAIEASLDGVFGLGAAHPYLGPAAGRLLLAQGDLECPPLRSGRWGVVLFSASLHYAANLRDALRRAVEALQPSGSLVVMDTPIARQPFPGTGHGDRHLGYEELNDALAAAGLDTRWSRIFRGPRWWAHQAHARVRGEQAFSFPLVIARRSG